MDKICEYDKCTGCSACVNICPTKSILLKEDKFGELHPCIDNNRCINCGLCRLSCPNNNNLKFEYPRHCYASWIKDKEKRAECASGGLGTILAEYVIRYKGGVVFGTKFDKDLNPVVCPISKSEDIEYFKGSKYVQSYISSTTFKTVKQLLCKGIFVLYIGTPCQIAGLKSYLKREYDNLISVDLICHGVSPMIYLKEEINEVCTKHNIDKSKLTNIRFRGNDKYPSSRWSRLLGLDRGNNFTLTLWGNEDGQKRRFFCQSKIENYYLAGFLMGITLRENCYSCNYARPERISDITIGDFIGLGKKIPFNHHVRHVSSVTLNTNKGESFYHSLSEVMGDLCNVERTYAERLEYKPSLLRPYKRHPLNPKFRRLCAQRGYDYAIRNTLYSKLLLMRIKQFVNVNKNRLFRLFKH